MKNPQIQKPSKPTLITSNKNKADEFLNLMQGQIELIQMEYPEIRSDDSCEVAMTAAKMLSGQLGKTVIVEDSGLFIHALGGFPGTVTKYATKKVGNKGLLKLMQGVKNRKCEYRSAIGYCEPGKAPLCFFASEQGKIPLMEAGKNGWGNDSIFLPKGKTKTYAQIKKSKEPGKFRIRSVRKLREYLSGKA